MFLPRKNIVLMTPGAVNSVNDPSILDVHR